MPTKKKTSDIKRKSTLRERLHRIGNKNDEVHLELFKGTEKTLKECQEEIKKAKDPRIKKKFLTLENLIEKELLS
jgi:hypothetical protein